jgi:hypothetical protein
MRVIRTMLCFNYDPSVTPHSPGRKFRLRQQARTLPSCFLDTCSNSCCVASVTEMLRCGGDENTENQ